MSEFISKSHHITCASLDRAIAPQIGGPTRFQMVLWGKCFLVPYGG
jgi:hypothetical protein